MMNFPFIRPTVALKRVAFMALLLIGMISANEVSAQSINDWVGSRQLVSEIVAIQRLEPTAASLKQLSQNQQGMTDALTNNPQAVTTEDRLQFFTAVIQQLRANGRTTRDAVNAVAVEFIDMGVPAPKVTSLVGEVLNLLS